MKKFFAFLFIVVFGFFLFAYIIFAVYEDRFVETFKAKIIDKTNISLNFSKVHFSIIKNFPYGSFILDNAQIFYSKENHNDTLLKADFLSFKINTINLFQSIYEFPEITITDGLINIKGDKLNLLFPSKSNKEQDTIYLIDTKRIKLNKCSIKYSYSNVIRLNLNLNSSTISGSFLSNAISLRLNLQILTLTGSLKDFRFKSNNSIVVTANIKERNDTYFSENGLIKFRSFPVEFSFIYSSKSDGLQIASSIKNISAKDFSQLLAPYFDVPISNGKLSLYSYYILDFKNSASQKLTLKYELRNIFLANYKDFSLLHLQGTTTFSGDFDKNITDLQNISSRYAGFEFVGTTKIKNLPKPYVLVDFKVRNIREMQINQNLTVYGNLSGNIKSLIKIENINNINFNTLNINKLFADLNISNLSFKNIDFIKRLEGNISINESSLRFRGDGLLYNNQFEGTVVIPNFLNVALHNASPSPTISVVLDHLNLDSAIFNSGKGSNTDKINFHLNSKVKSAIYRGITIKDLSLVLNGDNGNYLCNYFDFKGFSGTITGKFNYFKQNGAFVSLSAQKVDIQNIFKSLNNFGQNIITSTNISGSLSGVADLSYKISSNGTVNPKSIILVSNITVENGKLTGVGQLNRVSKFLNINEIDSIRFKTLHNKIEVENGMVKVPSMNISSNAINFQLTGQHGFDGAFTYWLKLNLREVLAKKFLLKKTDISDFENDSKNGLNLFLKIYGNTDSFKVGFDKKNTAEHIKNSLSQEGVLLKSIIKEEFSLSKTDHLLQKDSLTLKGINIFDSTHNKNQKKPFRIEWDEIDSTKKF